MQLADCAFEIRSGSIKQIYVNAKYYLMALYSLNLCAIRMYKKLHIQVYDGLIAHLSSCVGYRLIFCACFNGARA